MILTVDIKKRLGDFTLGANFSCDIGVTGLLGESGSGKSITLKCISGIMRPDEGRITLGSRVLFDSASHTDISPQKRRVGLLLQGGALFPNMDVERNILAGRRELTMNEARIKAEKLMERFGLTEKKRLMPAQLSGGQAQRCALARILMGSPDILLLDEPLTALDNTLKWRMEQELIDTLGAFSGPVIYVTHDRSEAYRLCDGICVISAGRASGVRNKRELFAAPVNRAEAMLTGCKNISSAKPCAEGRLYARDWGTELACAAPCAGVLAVGVRAHSIGLVPFEGANAVCCRVKGVTEDVFERAIALETPGGAIIYAYIPNADSPPAIGKHLTVYIAPEAVMPLF